MALQIKNKFEGLSDIILGVMGQVPVPFSVASYQVSHWSGVHLVYVGGAGAEADGIGGRGAGPKRSVAVSPEIELS
jgi:uncharacterized protein (DUF779 family)